MTYEFIITQAYWHTPDYSIIKYKQASLPFPEGTYGSPKDMNPTLNDAAVGAYKSAVDFWGMNSNVFRDYGLLNQSGTPLDMAYIISRLEEIYPIPTGYIIDFTAPTEAEVGSTVVITTNVYAGAWGDYYNYIVDADTGTVIDGSVIYVPWAGTYTFTNKFTMPSKDLNYRIEYYDEPPPGYPVPLMR